MPDVQLGQNCDTLQQEVVKLMLVLPFIRGQPGHILLGFQGDEMSLVRIATGSLLHRLHTDNGVYPGLASSDQDHPLHTVPPGGLCISDISDSIHLYHTQQFQLLVQSLTLSPHLLQVE